MAMRMKGVRRDLPSSADYRSLLRRAWPWLRLVIGLGLLAVLLWGVDWRATWRVLREASLGHISLALIIMLVSLLPRVLRWRVLLQAQGTQVPVRKLLSMYLIGDFFSNFLPSNIGGDSVRMVYLVRETEKRANAVASVLVERLCGLFTVLVLGVAAVLGNWRMAWEARVAPLVLAALFAFLLALVLLAKLRSFQARASRLKVQWLAELIAKTSRLYDAIRALAGQRHTLWQVLLFSLLFRLVQVSGLYVQAMAVRVTVPFSWFVTVISLVAVVTALPISLNAIGIQEGAYVFFFGLVGIAAPQALALALLARAVRMAVSLIGGALYLLGR